MTLTKPHAPSQTHTYAHRRASTYTYTIPVPVRWLRNKLNKQAHVSNWVLQHWYFLKSPLFLCFFLFLQQELLFSFFLSMTCSKIVHEVQNSFFCTQSASLYTSAVTCSKHRPGTSEFAACRQQKRQTDEILNLFFALRTKLQNS